MKLDNGYTDEVQGVVTLKSAEYYRSMYAFECNMGRLPAEDYYKVLQQHADQQVPISAMFVHNNLVTAYNAEINGKCYALPARYIIEDNNPKNWSIS